MTARQRWTLAVACAATFMLLLDVTVVNVALPDIAGDLGADLTDLQWVVDAYALTLATFLLSAGSLADRLGRRRVFAAGLIAFAATSLLCGLAWSPLVLDLARGAQGIGAAAMFATSLALLAHEFPERGRGVAFGVWGAVTGGAIAIGPLIGGALVEAAGWQWIFLVNVPIAVVTVLAARTRIEESRDPHARRVDVLGLLTIGAAMFLLVFALVRGNQDGWGDARIVVPLVAAASLLLAFAAIELRSSHPMLDLRLFRRAGFTGVASVAFTQSVAIYPLFLYIALYLQDVLGYSALETGLRFLPLTLVLFAVAPVAGRFTGRVPPRVLMGSALLVMGVGLVLMHGLRASSDWTALLAGLLVGGVGVGAISPALASSAIAVLPAARSGLASGVTNTFRQLGIATGIAGLGAVFEHRIGAELGGSPALAHAVAGGHARDAASRAAFVSGLNEIFLVAAAVAFVGALLCFALVRGQDLAHEPVAGVSRA